MLNSFLKKKSDIFELISIAIIAAIGAGLVATYLTGKVLVFGTEFPLYLGLLLIIIVALYFFKKWKPIKPVEENIRGFFCYDPKENLPIYIPRYRFSSNLNS